MKRRGFIEIPKRGARLMALLLALLLAGPVPARAAGFWSWLTGGEDEAVEAVAEVTPAPTESAPDDRATETLPPIPEDWSFETAMPETAVTAAPEPIPAAAIEDDGMLRVDLRTLFGLPQLHLRFAGVYAVEGDPGFRFDRDAQVTLTAADGSVYLSAGGLNIDMGQSLTLTRHRAEEGAENGIYIEESEKEALYCGDLWVSAEGEGLRAILTIQVEDYLCGVVAYEMSDAFPIEALKAQAVAARTYAMQRKRLSGGRDYDLVDTTADQVFKGYTAEYANVAQAVEETRGVVGLYKGDFAICYYTASNGGQTALASQVWSSTADDGYLAMVDDPYDLENPRSLVNELTITPACEGSAALKAMLEAALGERLAAEGYGEGEWAMESIASIEPVEPRFEGSRMYDSLEFALRARLLKPVETPTPEPTETPEPTPAAELELVPGDGSESGEDGVPGEARNGEDVPRAEAAATDEAQDGISEDEAAADASPSPSAPAETDAADALAAVFSASAMPTAPDELLPEPTEVPREWVLSEETYAVRLDVYGQIKKELSLGLNRADYELISVETERNDAGEPVAFTLAMRRFGHGVGMSQRGAQRMAGHYGMGWQEIIAFYYPGLSVERMEWPEPTLTDLSALPSGVGGDRPRPTATPTPAPLPELEAGEYYAEVTATTLNVRQQPTTASQAIAQLAKGRRLIVCGPEDADGWVPIRTAELKGFVKAEYLKPVS